MIYITFESEVDDNIHYYGGGGFIIPASYLKPMIVLINNFNRLTLPVKMADWLSKRGCEPVFIDNASDYPPLIQYYNDTPFQVLRLEKNYGHYSLWWANVVNRLNIKDRFIYTDPDLDLEGVPDDFVSVLNEGLDRYPQYSKCGLSLETEDLPDNEEGNLIRRIEAPYWQFPLDERYFHADTDTTLALYRLPIGEYGHSACRTNRPYTCRHLPWYYLKPEDLTDEEQYYYRTANASCSHKKRFIN